MLYEGDMAIFIEIGCGSFYLVKIKLLSVSKFHTTLPMDMCDCNPIKVAINKSCLVISGSSIYYTSKK